MRCAHKTVARVFVYGKEEQVEKEFEVLVWRLGHGSGDTHSDEPNTLEQSHGLEELEVMDKEILNRQIDVKGDS